MIHSFLFIIMKIEDIIEGLNLHIEDIRRERGISSKGHLVLQRIIEPHPTFKAYKTYKAILWFIKGKDKCTVLEVSHSDKVLDGQEGYMCQYINTELCRLIFNWIGTDSYKDVIQGELKSTYNT